MNLNVCFYAKIVKNAHNFITLWCIRKFFGNTAIVSLTHKTVLWKQQGSHCFVLPGNSKQNIMYWNAVQKNKAVAFALSWK